MPSRGIRSALVASLCPSLGLIDEGVSETGIVHTEEVTETVHQSECLVRVVPPLSPLSRSMVSDT